MALLAIETSVPTARVALLGLDGACLAAREQTSVRASSVLLPICDEALRAAGLRPADLRGISCGSGPGSFTGLRVGMAVAKGLALPTGVPLLLVPSLLALAHDIGAPPGALVIPCTDAGKGEVYAQLFRAASADRVEALDEAWVVAPGALCERVRATAGSGLVRAGGTGIERYADLFRAALGLDAVQPVAGPSALASGRLALARLARGESDDLASAVPAYGRPPDITKPKRSPLGPGGRSG